MNLNDAQEEAVRHRGAPLLIVAGAGSGKTRALTERIVGLVDSGEVGPEEILAITFTNKAAREMRERVLLRLGPRGRNMWLMTFHRASIEILRRDIDRLGYPKNFTVYDQADQLAVVRLVVRRLGLDEKRFPPSSLLHRISALKNEGEGPTELRAQGGFFEDRLAAVMEGYNERLASQGALDFDDLIGKTCELLEHFEDVRERWQRRFKHVLVDEYQDTNPAQYRWLRLIAGGGAEVAVVGDPDQSIYGWRGADIRNILEFEKDFPGAHVVILDRNYRSTKTILEAANAVIRMKPTGHPKELWTEGADGEPISRIETVDDRAEADAVAEEITSLIEGGRRPDDIAVLFRTNAQTRSLEEALIRARIPYRVLAGVRFYERAEVKDILAYARLVLNPRDEMALRRIINVPKRGIGDKTVEKLIGSGLLSDGLLDAAAASLGGAAGAKVQAFAKLLGELRGEALAMLPASAVKHIAEASGIIPSLRAEGTDEALGRIENIDALIARAKEAEEEGDDLEGFLSRVALVSDIDEADAGEGTVVLMTLHAAKGLEFGCVFLVGLEEGLLPHSRSLYEERQLDEERRLFYVGITRAKDRLYLTRAMRRMIWGEAQPTMPSRFLEEIPGELLVDWKAPKRGPVAPSGRPGTPSAIGLRLGDRVHHATFGRGTVISRRGEGEDELVQVAFDGRGVKTLSLRLAGLLREEA